MALTHEQKRQTIKMREQNIGYCTIAKELGTTKDQVIYFCKSYGIAGYKGEQPIRKEMTCKVCGKTYYRNAKWRGNVFCSTECRQATKKQIEKKLPRDPLVCPNCGKHFVPRNNRQKFCCQKCGITYKRRMAQKPRSPLTCPNCGKRFVPRDDLQKSCCQKSRICPVCKKTFYSNINICCSKDCQTIRQSQKNKETAIKKFNDRNKGRYFYVSGYEHYESDFYVRCVACDSIVHIGKGMIRRVAKERPECQRIIREAKAHQKAIEDAEAKKRRMEEKLAKANRRYRYACAQCGEEFVAKRKGMKYCSNTCYKRAGYRKREVTRRLRCKNNGDADWDISIDKLIKRDGRACHICGKQINANDYTITDDGAFIAHGTYPSIDHVFPLSLGGTHTWDNVRLAHMKCNETKRDKLFYKTQGGQIAIAI